MSLVFSSSGTQCTLAVAASWEYWSDILDSRCSKRWLSTVHTSWQTHFITEHLYTVSFWHAYNTPFLSLHSWSVVFTATIFLHVNSKSSVLGPMFWNFLSCDFMPANLEKRSRKAMKTGEKTEKKIRSRRRRKGRWRRYTHRQRSSSRWVALRCVGIHSFYDAVSQRGFGEIGTKLSQHKNYNRRRPDGWLN